MKIYRLRPILNNEVIDKCLYFNSSDEADSFCDFIELYFPNLEMEKVVFDVYKDASEAKNHFVKLLNIIQQ